MRDPQYETITRYKRHREMLLREIGDFVDVLCASERRLIAEVNAYTAHRHAQDPCVRARRRREHLEMVLRNDATLALFQRRWLVVLFVHEEGPLRLGYEDDFFLVPVAELGLVRVAEASRLLLIEKAAGRAAVFKALDERLDLRSRGEASRLPSDPPWELNDTRLERNFAIEDPIAVRVCKNDTRPEGYAQRIAAEAYSALRDSVGYREGRRLPPHPPGNRDAERWKQITKGIRDRWPKLDRTLGPFPI